jgi:choline dehydrogenase-like flavoprotein
MAGASPYEKFWEPPREEHDHFGLRGSRLFVKGGTTHHWGGWSLRFKPEDFELQSRTGRGADWPISYQDLAPFYTRAEVLLGIEGDSDNDDPPRYGGRFPFPAAPYTLNDMPVIGAFERLDMSYGHMPMARNADRCITTGTCRVCPVNARYTAAYDLSHLLTEYPERLSVRTEAPVTEVLMDSKVRARGVRLLDIASGRSEDVEGDRVVVSSGTVESAKLLLASTSPDWPDGVGNASGHVGRHLVGHPLIFATGFRPGNPEKSVQELGFITLACRHFDTPEYQRDGKMLFARVGDDGETEFEREILGNVPRSEIERKMTSGMHLAFEASIEQFESPENRVTLGGDSGQPGLRATQIEFTPGESTAKALETHTQNLLKILRAAGCSEASLFHQLIKPDGAHAVSTCRMSGSESDGVVDGDLRVHGTENVFVCSNGVFPNVTAVNPTLTVAALAVRLAEHLTP